MGVQGVHGAGDLGLGRLDGDALGGGGDEGAVGSLLLLLARARVLCEWGGRKQRLAVGGREERGVGGGRLRRGKGLLFESPILACGVVRVVRVEWVGAVVVSCWVKDVWILRIEF